MVGIARAVFVDLQQFGNVGLAPLTQKRGAGPAREGAAAAGEGFRVAVAVGVEQAEPAAQEIVGVLEFLAVHVVVVVALRVHHAHGRIKAPRAGIVVAPQIARAEPPVELVAQVVVHQPHAGGDIPAVARRLAKMLAEEQRVVAGDFRVEIAVAVVVPVTVAMRHVELPLDLPQVAGVAGVVVERPEEVVRHVLDGVEAETVGLRGLHHPARVAAQVGADVFLVEIRIGRDHRLGDRRAVEPDPPLRRMPVVELGIVRMPHDGRLVVPAAFGRTEILVGRFVGDVQQVGEPQVHHLPGVVPVAGVVPLAAEPVGGGAQMEILRHHARKNVRRRGLVVQRHVVGPVVHDVVEIHPDAEAVAQFDQTVQVRLGAVARGDGSALVLAAQVKRIKQIVPHRIAPVGLGRRRQPQRRIPRFRQLGHLVGDFVPTGVEKLQHRLAPRQGGTQQSPHPQGDSCPLPPASPIPRWLHHHVLLAMPHPPAPAEELSRHVPSLYSIYHPPFHGSSQNASPAPFL